MVKELTNPDYLIIGAGVAGCATAYELARQGAKVTLLERGVAGAESSWAGSGILSVLPPWQYSDAVNILTEWSLKLYPDWIAAMVAASGIDPEYKVDGMLVLPQHDPQYDAVKARVWCERYGVPMELVAARDLVPNMGMDSEGTWLPQVAQVRNPRLMKSLRRALEMQGVRIIEQVEVTELRVAGSRVVALETRHDSYSAGDYIVTAGAWSSVMLGEWAQQVQIKPIRGQILLFKAAPGLLTTIIRQNGIYLVPRRDGHILVGSTREDVGFDKRTTQEARALFFDRATAILPPLKDAELVRQWAGLRPGSPDNIPTIDRHPQLENLYINSGHFRYGLSMAPASACLLSNILHHRAQPINVAPYLWQAIAPKQYAPGMI